MLLITSRPSLHILYHANFPDLTISLLTITLKLYTSDALISIPRMSRSFLASDGVVFGVFPSTTH